MERNFFTMLAPKWEAGKFICVGLDTSYDKIPQHIKTDRIGQSLFLFNKEIIDATCGAVAAYKPNTAFYEAYGSEGIAALEETIDYIRVDCADYNIPVILDAKRGDIGNTNNGYAQFAFDILKADAITVSPYLGSEAMKPFLERKEKGIIVLCRTSNEGAGEFQDAWMQTNTGSKRMYEMVAETVANTWNYNGNCLLVVGATVPEELQHVRSIVGNMPLLVPGVGKQGGKLREVLTNGLTDGGRGIIINSSRDVIYASSDQDFANNAYLAVSKMNVEIENFLLAVE